MIGYPGMDEVVVGARGVYRAELHVHGTASHSGASRSTPNAIDKAAHLVQELGTTDLPGGTSADTRPTLVQLTTRWPPYALPADSRLRTTLLQAAHTFGVHPEPKIAGPSNIGNYLAGLGIPATAGFGVTYAGLHATDERIRLDTIPRVQAIYHATLLFPLTPNP